MDLCLASWAYILKWQAVANVASMARNRAQRAVATIRNHNTSKLQRYKMGNHACVASALVIPPFSRAHVQDGKELLRVKSCSYDCYKVGEPGAA